MKRKLLGLTLLLLLVTLVFTLTACFGGGSGVGKEDCEHHWYEEIQSASCEENGWLTKHCELCGEHVEERIPATGHDVVISQAKAPTCTESGLTEGKFCNRCNTVIVEQDIISALGHTLATDAAVAATCETAGLTEGKHCTVCEEVVIPQTEVNKLGHNVMVINGLDSTCTEAGYSASKKCSRCDYVEVPATVIAPKGHTNATIAGTLPTCTEDGTKAKIYCSVCQEVFQEPDVIPSNGHKIVTTGATAPTCQAEGTTGGKHCSVCNVEFEVSSSIATVDHKFEGGSCVWCQLTQSAGLTYADVDSDSCEVTGIGTFTGTELVIPEKHENKDVVGIADGAFEGATTITKVVVTGKLEYIGDGAFFGCTALESVTLDGSVTSVGSEAFEGCTSLEAINCEDFSQTEDWATDYLGSTDAKLLADKKDGLKPHELYALAMKEINANLDRYVMVDKRTLDMDDYANPTEMIQAIIARCELEMGVRVEYAGTDFYTYQYEKYAYDNDTTYSKQWYYNGYFYQAGTDVTAQKVKVGTEFMRETMANAKAQSTYEFSEGFFNSVEFMRNSDGTYKLVVDVSGDAMTEFLLMMAGSMGDAFEKLGFQYDDVVYVYNFDANGDLSTIKCNANFHFMVPDSNDANANLVALTGKVILDQEYSEVGTLTAVKTAPSGSFQDKSYNALYPNNPCTHRYKKTVPGYEATCTEPGLTNGYYCGYCLANIEVAQVIPAKGHTVENGVCTVCEVKAGFSTGLVYQYNSDGKTATLIGLGTCRDEDIVIPAEIHGVKITKIASTAFNGGINVKSVTIPETVTEIEAGAFDSISHVTKFTIPAHLAQYLPKTATEIVISSGTVIKTGSFVNFTSLTTITLPETLEEIEDGAFVGCTRLVFIFDNSDMNIYRSEDAFGGISKYAFEIIRKGQTSSYFILDDFIFMNFNGEYYLEKYIGSDETVILPNDCNGKAYSVESRAFAGISSIKAIYAPKTLTNISSAAFDDCTSTITKAVGSKHFISAVPKDNLAEVEVSGDTIDSDFMRYCESLVKLTVSAKVIGGRAFSECDNLETIILTDEVEKIGYSFASGCDKLKELHIGRNVSTIENGVMNGIKNVDLYLYDVGAWCEISFTKNQNAYSSSYNFLPCVDNIYVNGNLTRDIVVPAGTTKISDFAFYSCTAIDSVQLPTGIVSIGKYAFSSAKNLKSINIPEGVTTIGENAFSYASSLESILLPSTLEAIPKYCFAYCSSLCEVDADSIGDSGISEVGDRAFEECSSLVSVYLPDTLTKINSYAFYRNYKLQSVELGSVTEIGERAFYDCTSLKYATLPETVVTIGSYAFYSTALLSVRLPASLTTLASYAFSNCTRLYELVNNSGITIEKNHNSLVAKNAIVITMGESTIDYVGDFGFLTDIQGNVYLIDYVGTDKNLVLPEDYNGNAYSIANSAFRNSDFVSVTLSSGVKAIGASAFVSSSQLLSVTLGENLASIGSDAFYNCGKLLEVINLSSKEWKWNFPETVDVFHKDETKIDYVGDFAFYKHSDGNTYLVSYFGSEKTIVLPEYYEGEGYCIYDYALYYTDATEIIVPETILGLGENFFDASKVKVNVYENVKYLGNSDNPYVIALGVDVSGYDYFDLVLHDNTLLIAPSAFSSRAYYIKSIDFGNSLRYIAKNAFNGHNLTSIILPDTVKYVGNSAFYSYSSAVTELYLGSSLEYIGNNAFAGFSSLEELTIPASVKFIGNGAFADCSSLTKINYNAISAEVGPEAEVFNAYLGGYKEINVVIGAGVKKLPDSLFGGYGMSSEALVNMTVSDMNSLEYIGAYSFSARCEWLTALDLSNVKYIGDYAFKGVYTLKSIKLGENLEYVGTGAFENCTGLETAEFASDFEIFDSIFGGCTSIKFMKISLATYRLSSFFGGSNDHIPTTLVKLEVFGDKICEHALWSNKNLKEIDIASSVKVVEYEAFYDTYLTELVFKDGLVEVCERAFSHCTKLKNVVLPKTVEKLGPDFLSYAYALETLEMPFIGEDVDDATSKFTYFASTPSTGNGGYYKSIPTYLKTLKLTNVKVLPEQPFYLYGSGVVNNIETVIIEGDLEVLPANCFTYMSKLKSVTLPEGLVEIGRFAFNECKALETVNIPSTVEIIREWAFYNAQALKSISIPDSVRIIEDSAFYWTDVPYSYLDKSIFYKYDNAYYLGNETNNYILLYKVVADDISAVTSCEIAPGTKFINCYAFTYCASIESIQIPESVTAILKGAFSSSGITEIVIPDTVTTLGGDAFYSNSKLTTVTIGSGITSIGYQTFANCYNLKVLNLPASVKSIASEAFYNTSLEKVNVESLEAWLEVENNSQSGIFSTSTVLYINGEPLTDLAIPDDVTEIKAGAFTGYRNFNSVILANDLKVIGNNAFQNTSSNYIVIGEGIESIGTYAFSNTNVNYITVGKNVVTIGSHAFYGSYAKAIYLPKLVSEDALIKTYSLYGTNGTIYTEYQDASAVPGEKNWIYSSAKIVYGTLGYYVGDDGEFYVIKSDKTAILAAYAGSGDVVVLDTINGEYKVTEISDKVFNNNEKIKSFKSGAYVTKIPGGLFSNCKTIVSVDLSASTALTTVEANAFYLCDSLTSVILPDSLETIGDYAFYRCSKLNNVTFHEKLASIGYKAFEQCTALTAIAIPDSLTTLGENAFYGCTGVKTLTLGTGLDVIPKNAFNSVAIEELVIPDNVTTISAYAFGGSKKIKTLVIGSGVTSIKAYAFSVPNNVLTSLTVKNLSGTWKRANNVITFTDDVVANAKTFTYNLGAEYTYFAQ